MSSPTLKANVSRRAIYRSTESINREDWNAVESGRNIYLTLDYLSALEKGMSDEIDFFYAISYDAEDRPVLVSAFQLVTFVDKRRKYTDHLCKIHLHLKKKIENVFTINVLVCGNVFSDGENGFLWSDQISPEVAFDEIDEVTKEIKERSDVKDKVSITLFKEFWPKTVPHSKRLKERSYRDFMIDVNMVLSIHESWKNFDDYLMSMKTKFRTRAKGVMKKSKEIEIRSLNAEEILAQKERIQELFENVLSKSDFQVGTLNTVCFSNFKECLGDSFELKAFYLNDQMVGFSSSFKNKGFLEANFVGLDYNFNKEYGVYQRILYDYVEQALNAGSKELQLGRTSELIKSSIGAIPTNMKLYVKHKKSVSNLILKPILHSISPSEFELRQPFKANFTN